MLERLTEQKDMQNPLTNVCVKGFISPFLKNFVTLSISQWLSKILWSWAISSKSETLICKTSRVELLCCKQAWKPQDPLSQPLILSNPCWLLLEAPSLSSTAFWSEAFWSAVWKPFLWALRPVNKIVLPAGVNRIFDCSPGSNFFPALGKPESDSQPP